VRVTGGAHHGRFLDMDDSRMGDLLVVFFLVFIDDDHTSLDMGFYFIGGSVGVLFVNGAQYDYLAYPLGQ